MKTVWIFVAIVSAALGQPQPVQVQTQAAAFDAVSLKASKDASWHDRTDTGMMIEHGATLKDLVVLAFDVKDYQVTGGPKWIESDHWDVDGKAAGPAKDAELSRMLQTVLEERFHLVVHHESKPVAGFALLVAKGGIRAKRAEDTAHPTSKSHGGSLQAHAQSMGDLASWLARRTAMPVIDATGLIDLFDFSLEWDPSQDRSAQSVPMDLVPAAADPKSQPLGIALQEQLGLRLEGRKVPIDVIVVDRAEKPVLN